MTKRVLVVDDDPVIRSLLRDYLSTSGFTVECLAESLACLPSLRSQRPDVLILDMIMPESTGLQVLDEIRRDPDLQNLPVIMLSANAEEEARQTWTLKADVYLEKPFEFKDVLEAIKKVCP